MTYPQHVSLITPPAEEPVSVADLKKHLRIDYADDDTLLADYIIAAREYCEVATSRTFVTTTLEYRLPCFSSLIRLPRAPLIAVSSVVYTDASGADVTLSPSSYKVSAGSPGFLAPAYGRYFPTARAEIDCVRIAFTAGYGTASDVPARARQAIRLLAGHAYEHREAVSDVGMTEIPLAVDSLLGSLQWGFVP